MAAGRGARNARERGEFGGGQRFFFIYYIMPLQGIVHVEDDKGSFLKDAAYFFFPDTVA